MEKYNINEINTSLELCQIANQYSEPFYLQCKEFDDNLVIMPYQVYGDYMAQIAKLDTELHRKIILAVGDESSGFGDNSIGLHVIANIVGVDKELVRQVAIHLDDVFSGYGEDVLESCPLSPIGWDLYEEYKMKQLND